MTNGHSEIKRKTAFAKHWPNKSNVDFGTSNSKLYAQRQFSINTWKFKVSYNRYETQNEKRFVDEKLKYFYSLADHLRSEDLRVFYR